MYQVKSREHWQGIVCHPSVPLPQSVPSECAIAVYRLFIRYMAHCITYVRVCHRLYNTLRDSMCYLQ